jgi:hypothetical protein
VGFSLNIRGVELLSSAATLLVKCLTLSDKKRNVSCQITGVEVTKVQREIVRNVE